MILKANGATTAPAADGDSFIVGASRRRCCQAAVS